ncbi:MAG TPA: peptide chain release factor N(5)-glutamine methyltransferase [Solirubrobacterales bacterium]|nr:peptide chain release factor N(5)-glutamine methyltransferase [Solirubrobacterales bacterium]
MSSAVAGSVGEALASAADALAAAGVDSPRLDAELLLAEATGADRARLAATPEAGVTAVDARAFGTMVRRRVRREPLAYIVGRKGFRGIELAVDRRVLIPRPETELLVELALELEPAAVLDVGTGSGAIALAIADELGVARVPAPATSLDALAVAEANRERLGLGERVELAFGTLAEGRFDLVVANLPYVADGDWAALPAEIREYEPREALLAGPTGLDAIDALLAGVSLAAEPPRAVALEVGEGQAPTVAELVRRTGFERVETRRDLAGIERVVAGWA